MKRMAFAMALVICLAAPCIAADLNSVSGTYIYQPNNSEFLKLRPDATFVLKQKKTPPDSKKPFVKFSGKYELNGETITLKTSDGGTAKGQLRGNVFTDNQGKKWVKKEPDREKEVKSTQKHWWQRF